MAQKLFLNSNLLFILMSYAHFFRILVYRFSYVKYNISFNIDMITSIIRISQQTTYIVFNVLHDIEMFYRSFCYLSFKYSTANRFINMMIIIQYLQIVLQHLKPDITCSEYSLHSFLYSFYIYLHHQ